MIVGIGHDIVDISRIEKSLKKPSDRFKNRIFTKGEIDLCDSKPSEKLVASAYAKRFAAKEAVVKALGTGFSGGIKWVDIEVVKLENGKPSIELYGKALEYLQKLSRNAKIHISLTDDYPVASAFVVVGVAPCGDPRASTGPNKHKV